MAHPIRIGIVGGGQLGKMLGIAAKQMGLFVAVTDPTPQSPAGQIVDVQIVADYKDEKAIRKLADMCDVITFEIELANDKVLNEIRAQGKAVHPNPKTLGIIRDKLIQKRFLKKNGIPTAEFLEVSSVSDIENAAKKFGYPFLLKAREDAYDGRGNFLVKRRGDIQTGMYKLKGRALYIEKFVPFIKELAINVARTPKGEMALYPVVQTFHTDNICDTVIAPAPVSAEVKKRAERLARKTIEILKGAGVFGIEMFLLKNGSVLINEIAPRVHNSGHYTIEACVTSQFEQHIRAICGFPLGSTKMLVESAVMKNILGTAIGDGFPKGIEKVLKIPGLSLHLYGKKESRHARKMGHITVVGNSAAQNLRYAHKARKLLTI